MTDSVDTTRGVLVRYEVDDVDDLLWGLLLVALAIAVLVFSNTTSRAWFIMFAGFGAFCGLVLIGRAIVRRR